MQQRAQQWGAMGGYWLDKRPGGWYNLLLGCTGAQRGEGGGRQYECQGSVGWERHQLVTDRAMYRGLLMHNMAHGKCSCWHEPLAWLGQARPAHRARAPGGVVPWVCTMRRQYMRRAVFVTAVLL